MIAIPSQPQVPTRPERSATPQNVVETMLWIVGPTEDDILFDLGCGDGRIVIEAARKYQCRCVGVEIDPAVAKIARENVRKAGVSNLVMIRTGDARDEVLLGGATIVTMYLYPELVAELVPRCIRAHTIVSVSHRIPKKTQNNYQIHGKKVFVHLQNERQ